MAKVRIRSTIDEELQYRSQDVVVGNKAIVTPTKAIDPAKMDPTSNINTTIKCINELYALVSAKNVQECLISSTSSLNSRLNKKQKMLRNTAEEMTLCLLEFKEGRFPTQKEIEVMTDTAYVFSDITPLPMLSNIKQRIHDAYKTDKVIKYEVNLGKFEKFKKYLTDSIETIEQLNSKPIMGYIPDVRYYFDDIVDLYAKKGVNMFYFDAHLSNPITLQAPLRALMRVLNNYEILEESFIHMINPAYGRGVRGNDMIPAKDVLGFGFGVDGLGERHQRPPYFAARERTKYTPDQRSRLFDKKTYGYMITSEQASITNFYPNDSSVDVSKFLVPDKPDTKTQNSFNAEQLALESMHLRDIIAKSDPMLRYIETKSNVKKQDVKFLKRAKIRQAR